MSDEAIGIIGAGGHAREVISYCMTKVAFQAVDKQFIAEGLTDIENPDPQALAKAVVVAVGSPLLRKQLVERWPGNRYASAISNQSSVATGVTMGRGVQIAPMGVIMPGCVIGDHVVINVAATINHDCNLADYVTIGPGAHLGGNVHVDAGVFIGIGATVKNGIRIAKGVVLGAGAVIIHDADVENGVYVGNPARLIRTNDGWLNEL